MKRWTDRLIVGVVALTVIVLAADAVISIASGIHLNLQSGVWLALARDTQDGVFYRPLWNGAEYGGTRYFPMLFVLTAGLMRLGLNAVPAGVFVSMLGLVAMSVAVALLLKRLGVPRSQVLAASALSIAPYFVHETAFAIRCEPMAAAFAIFGLAAITPFETRAASASNILLAAVLFVAAFLTKITCVYAPAAATLALLLAGRRAAAVKVAAITSLGALVTVGLVNYISDGRAIESFRACALAGSSPLSLLSPAAVTRAVELIGTSHLLTVVFMVALVALIIRRTAWASLPALYFVATTAITGIIFTSPGTTLTSQIVDAYVAAVVVLVASLSVQSAKVRDLACVLLCALGVWMAAQNGIKIVEMVRANVIAAGMDHRRELISQVARCGGVILSESPLMPILAGQRPVLLDPFAFHVVALNRPLVEKNLIDRLGRREFPCVILEQDPMTERGRGWYRNVHLTWPVIEAISQGYRFDRSIGAERFYVPPE
jgi:hypothetical protein